MSGSKTAVYKLSVQYNVYCVSISKATYTETVTIITAVQFNLSAQIHSNGISSMNCTIYAENIR